MKLRCLPTSLLLSAASVFALASPALANPTQEDVFKSISDNVGHKSDDGTGQFLFLLIGIAIVVGLLVMFSKRRQRVVTPRALNHPGKLLKEILRGVNLRSAELRQLRTLSDDQSLQSPLTLLLCPSLLEKAVRERPGKVERKIIAQIARKLMPPTAKQGNHPAARAASSRVK